MTNATKRIVLGWSLVIAPVVFFCICLLLSSVRACPSTVMFWALMLASHMPFVALPFWAVFHGCKTAAIFWGWAMFFLGEVAFHAFYFTCYKDFGWPPPEVPAGILLGLPFGWIPGFLVTTIGAELKSIADRAWPLAPGEVK
jgi:hypothetical protein